MLKFTVKAIVAKEAKPPGFIIEFITLMSDRCNGASNDTVLIIQEKMREFLCTKERLCLAQLLDNRSKCSCEDSVMRNDLVCLQPWGTMTVNRDVLLTSILDVPTSNPLPTVTAPMKSEAFRRVVERTSRLLACKRHLDGTARQDRLSGIQLK